MQILKYDSESTISSYALPLIGFAPLIVGDESSRCLFSRCLRNLAEDEIGSIVDWDEGFFQAEMAGTRVAHVCLHEATRSNMSGGYSMDSHSTYPGSATKAISPGSS